MFVNGHTRSHPPGVNTNTKYKKGNALQGRKVDTVSTPSEKTSSTTHVAKNSIPKRRNGYSHRHGVEERIESPNFPGKSSVDGNESKNSVVVLSSDLELEAEFPADIQFGSFDAAHESKESEEENMEDPSLTTSSSNGEWTPARSVWHSCPQSIKQAKPSNNFGKTIEGEKSESPRIILPPGFELDDDLDIHFGSFAPTRSSEKKNESSLDTKEAPPKPKMVTMQNILEPVFTVIKISSAAR